MLQLYYEDDDDIECGIDEAGAGCLAGRLFTACVILPKKIDPEIAERAAVLANMKKQIALAKVNAQRAATIEAQKKIDSSQ